MAQIIPIGQPANDPEREAIGYPRDHPPGDYRIDANGREVSTPRKARSR